jgi:hypothetical protein
MAEKTMRKALLITMATLAGSWSAAAQQSAMPATSVAAVSVTRPIQQTSRRDMSYVRMPQMAATNERVSGPSWVDSAYDLTTTAFEQDVHVPMASLVGGRLQLGGYYRVVSAENFQMGLPGGGVLPSWSVGVQSHLLVTAPKMDQGAGFSVEMRLHGTGLRDMHWHAYQAVNRALAYIRGS